LEGKRDEAFVHLRTYAETFSSVEDIEQLEKDANYQFLRADPRFDATLAAARQRIAAAKMQPASR
ncbi:MAG: hypothetical protein JOY93_01295, partial [Acidobacteriales bacterium]|nr:hypothetical protein [Terriglobales bacterium]